MAKLLDKNEISAEAWKALGKQEIDACYTIDTFREKMKNGKAVGQEWIPAEAGKFFVNKRLMCYEEWRESVINCNYTYI